MLQIDNGEELYSAERGCATFGEADGIQATGPICYDTSLIIDSEGNW